MPMINPPTKAVFRWSVVEHCQAGDPARSRAAARVLPTPVGEDTGPCRPSPTAVPPGRGPTRVPQLYAAMRSRPAGGGCGNRGPPRAVLTHRSVRLRQGGYRHYRSERTLLCVGPRHRSPLSGGDRLVQVPLDLDRARGVPGEHRDVARLGGAPAQYREGLGVPAEVERVLAEVERERVGMQGAVGETGEERVGEDGVVGRGDRPPELVGERHGATCDRGRPGAVDPSGGRSPARPSPAANRACTGPSPAPSSTSPWRTASPATATARRAASTRSMPAARDAASAAECVHPAPWAAAMS